VKNRPLRSLLQPSNHSSGATMPANGRLHQQSATLHGFEGSPRKERGARCVKADTGKGDRTSMHLRAL